MNGKIQGIIVCGVIIACLGGTLAFLKATDDPNAAPEESSSEAVIKQEKVDESVQLVDLTASDVQSIVACNEYGGFTLERPASGKTEWNIVELTGINQSAREKSGMAEYVAQLEAYRTVEENSEDLSKYGLSEPTGSFTVTFKDGAQRTFLIGDVSTKTRYRYLCEEGDNTVYMVLGSRVSNFIEPVEDLVDTTLIASPSNDDMPDYGKLTLSRRDLDYDMVFENDDSEEAMGVSAQVMTEPVFAYLNITGSSATTHGMWGLTASSAEKLFPEESDLAEYGLDDPLAEVLFEGDGYSFDLKIGDSVMAVNEDGDETSEVGWYYCYLTGVSGIDAIWKIPAADLPWATVMPGDVISLIVSINILTVDDIAITANGVTADYVLDNDESSVKSVKKNGAEDIDVSLFKDLYQYLISCPTDEIYFDEIAGEPYLTVEIAYNGGSTATLEYFEESARRTLIAVDGRPSYRIPTSWAERFISNVENIDNGKDIITTY